MRFCLVTHINEACHTCEWVMSHTSMSHVTYVNEAWYTGREALFFFFSVTLLKNEIFVIDM